MSQQYPSRASRAQEHWAARVVNLRRIVPMTLTVGEYEETMQALHTIAKALQDNIDTFYAPKGPQEWYQCSEAMQGTIPTLGAGFLKDFMTDLRFEVMAIEMDRLELYRYPSGSDTQDKQEMDRYYTTMQVFVRVVQQVCHDGMSFWSPRHDRTRQERGSPPSRLCPRSRWILPGQ